MIVWKRKGLLVFVAIMLAMGTYALIVNLLGLNQSLGINVTNKEGQQFKLDNYSSLFFIRNKYWTYILLVLYIVIAFFIYKTYYA